MDRNWAAGIVGRMFAADISGGELADACGYSASYLSSVLHGNRGTDKTRAEIEKALATLEKEKCPEPVSGGTADADTV